MMRFRFDPGVTMGETEHHPHFDADDNFIHPCCVCGAQACLGFDVNLRNDKLGKWYCAPCWRAWKGVLSATAAKDRHSGGR